MSKELTLQDLIEKYRLILKSLRKNWKLISLISIMFALMFMGVAYVKGDKYTARMTFIFENTQNDMFANYARVASQFGISLGQSEGGLMDKENIIELMKSKRIIYSALLSEIKIKNKKQTIIDYHIDLSKYREDWKDDYILKDIDFTKKNTPDSIQKDSILDFFYKRINDKYLDIRKANTMSGIIILEVKTKDELLSKVLAEAILNSMFNFYKNELLTTANKNVMFLETRTDSVKNALMNLENTLAVWEDSNLGISKKEGLLKRRKLVRDIEILNIMYAELVKNLELARITSSNQQPIFQLIDKPHFPLEKSYISKPLAFIVGLFLGLFFSVAFFTFKTIFIFNLEQTKNTTL